MILSGDTCAILAGGTDLFPSWQQSAKPATILDLTRIATLKGIESEGSGWRIGATTCWTDLIGADLPPCFDGLKAAGREVGSPQIQNAGTIGGNLVNASPAADGIPPLLALDAEVEIVSSKATRKIALADFMLGARRVDLGDDEMVAAVLIPEQPEEAVSSFLKLGSRCYLVISIAMVAVTVVLDGSGRRIEELRIAVGSCAPTALRLPMLERQLIGCTREDLHDPAVINAEALSVLAPLDDIRASADYRIYAAGELCRRAVLAAMTPLDSTGYGARAVGGVS